jgi:hypothetical protein
VIEWLEVAFGIFNQRTLLPFLNEANEFTA